MGRRNQFPVLNNKKIESIQRKKKIETMLEEAKTMDFLYKGFKYIQQIKGKHV